MVRRPQNRERIPNSNTAPQRFINRLRSRQALWTQADDFPSDTTSSAASNRAPCGWIYASIDDTMSESLRALLVHAAKNVLRHRAASRMSTSPYSSPDSSSVCLSFFKRL